MPFQWVEPELLMEFRGIRVYHTYKDGDIERRSEFWYQAENGEEDFEFDVRDLPATDGVTASSWASGDAKVQVSTGKSAHRRIIKAAIEANADPFAAVPQT